jgi:SPP1 gp7 family putative phage head morphogenesis protein
VRLGTDPADALRKVWLGDGPTIGPHAPMPEVAGHFRGVVQPMAQAMANAHISGYLKTSEIIGEPSAAVTVDWQEYQPAAYRAATLGLETMQTRLAAALSAENTAKGQIQAVRDAFEGAGWTGDKPSAMAALSSGQIVASYAAGMYAAGRDSERTKGFVHRSILDSSTTVICEDRNGLRLPKDDPYWLSNFPPLHFNCRSVLMPVLTDGPWSDWRPTVPSMAGFGASPIAFRRKAA